jgi:hypothetical protein
MPVTTRSKAKKIAGSSTELSFVIPTGSLSTYPP